MILRNYSTPPGSGIWSDAGYAGNVKAEPVSDIENVTKKDCIAIVFKTRSVVQRSEIALAGNEIASEYF